VDYRKGRTYEDHHLESDIYRGIVMSGCGSIELDTLMLGFESAYKDAEAW